MQARTRRVLVVNEFIHHRYHYDNWMTYRRMIAPMEYVTIEVEDGDDFAAYYDFLARVRRDNMVYCSCSMCGNPRKKSERKNSMAAKTLQERRAYSAFVTDMNEENIQMPSSGWRARRVAPKGG